jgi:Ca2+-binding RTX toxin-like protein
MPTGTPGDDILYATSGQETFDGGNGVDTVSYANSTRGVSVNLGTGEATAVLKVMPFGDSITYGVISSGTVKNEQSGGYRIYLWNDLLGSDLAVDYVGSLLSGPSSFPDRDNAGFRGETIDYLNSVDANLLSTYQPDVVLLMIGTNDAKTDTAAQMISQLRSLLISIATNDPNATIFVAQIPPAYASARDPAVIQQYNAMIPGLIEELNDTYKVVLVDTSDLTLADITAPPADSGVHPTAAGYEKLAADFYNAMVASGVFDADRDTLTSIENVTGSVYYDRLVGNDQDNVLTGLAGNDELIGGGGNDTLDGGSGVDRMAGGAGDDLYIVDSSSDVVTENAGEGIDTIRTTKTTYSLVNLPNVENLTYTGTSRATLTGNDADNHIIAGPGGDTIDGKGGADTMEGGAGSDTYYVDHAGDHVVEASGAGTDMVMSSVSYMLEANVEKVTLTGSAHIDATGNELSNTLNGNSGNNVLTALAGTDTLRGYDGDDFLYGGDGKDTLIGGNGTDVLSGGSGYDTFQWATTGEAELGATRDQVTDFSQGKDHLDLSGIDARTTSSGNNTFSFIGANGFSSTAGELRAEVHHDAGGDYTIVQGDVNGDGIADFEIQLTGFTGTLQASDFIL